MIPIGLVTGFLGSGKTTFLQHLVNTYRDRKWVYLVNELAELDIDGRRLPLPPDRLVSLPGGSIFCRCLLSDFIRSLRLIAADSPSGVAAWEGLIIETSGIADPGVVQDMLLETRLDELYSVRRIVSVIDPGSFLKLIHTLPAVERQVQASSHVLLNKTDLYPPETIASTREAVEKINPQARILSTVFCQVDLDPFGIEEGRCLCGQYAACADPNYATVSIRHEKPIEWSRLREAILPLQDDLYRFKGFLRGPAGWLYIDYSLAGWSEQPVTPPENVSSTELALIVKGKAALSADALALRVRSGQFDAVDGGRIPKPGS